MVRKREERLRSLMNELRERASNDAKSAEMFEGSSAIYFVTREIVENEIADRIADILRH